jgi:protein SCO1/2
MKKIIIDHKFTILSLVIILAMFVITNLYHGEGGYKEWTQSSAVTKTASSGQANIGGSFTLTNHKGETVTEAILKDKFSLIFFGFTYCPDVCPTTLTKVTEVYENLPKEKQDMLNVYLVSIDPERDTPETLANYVGAFGDYITGLVGTPEQIKDIAKKYLVYYVKRGEGEDYLMDHSGFLYLMGPDGLYLTHLKHHDDVSVWQDALKKAMYK